jgi:hypothetical protein
MTIRVPAVSARANHRGVRLAVAAAVVMMTAACNQAQPVLRELMDARRLVGELRAAFLQASEASNRAVLADTDDVSAAAAKEAAEARTVVGGRVAALEGVVASLGYASEADMLGRFKARFAEYEKLDGEILGLAVENTNLKAQRLTFGAMREMADEISAELLAVGGPAASADVEGPMQAIRADVYELLFLDARHNAEAEEKAMLQIEQRVTAVSSDARQRLTALTRVVKGPSTARLQAAASLFDRLMLTHQEVIALSRRNTNVRSLALTFGRARVVAAECADALRLLQDSLATHGSEATR